MGPESERLTAVLARFPALAAGRAIALGNHGGFSGARLWRVETDRGPYCLRRWPSGTVPGRLAAVHRWVRQAESLPFVPGLASCDDGASVLVRDSHCWDAARWCPGAADDSLQPAAPRVTAACVALAQLHEAWAAPAALATCPAIQRRLDRTTSWLRLVASGWRPRFGPDDEVQPWAARAWAILGRHAPHLPALLEPWRARPVSVQPCLCDIWRPHVLFVGDAVSGIVDYGSMKVDHVAVDLARLLGSWVGDKPDLIAVGMEAYRSVRALSPAEKCLVGVLDRTAALLGAANWLEWLYGPTPRAFEDRAAVARRVADLVARLERMPPPGLLLG